MTDQERFEKENEYIADVIWRGQFLNAKQGIELGELIAEGLTKGLSEPIELPICLEGSE